MILVLKIRWTLRDSQLHGRWIKGWEVANMPFNDAKQRAVMIFGISPCLDARKGEKRLKTPLNRFTDKLLITATVSESTTLP